MTALHRAGWGVWRGGMATAQISTKKREHAALLVAEDDLTDEAIAQAVGIGRRTLATWKTQPEFAALVGDAVGQVQAAMLKLSIARKHKRLAVLDDLHTKALAVIEERAQDNTGAPGEATGLMVRQVKQIGVGKSAQVIEEYAVDTGLMREIRALHEQAAKELGQWSDKHEIAGAGGVPLMVQLIEREDGPR